MATSNEIRKGVDQIDVVMILANDMVFCRHWMLFCRKLNFPQSTMYDLEKMGKMNSPISDIILKIMDYWKSSFPAEAISLYLAQILRELGCTKSADDIDSFCGHPSSSNAQKSIIWFNTRHPTRYFSGREMQMQIIDRKWKECQETKTMLIVAITGLGGIGKSELARNFATTFHQSYRGDCIWIDAEASQDIYQSFHNLAYELKIHLQDEMGKNKSLEFLAVEVYKTLFDKPCLLIFDNLESYDQPILKSLYDLASKQHPNVLKPFVLTTSRFQPAVNFFGSICHQIALDNLTSDTAIQFFSRYLLVDQNSIDDSISTPLKKLCERLQCYPLAMQQAAAYINESTSHGLGRNSLDAKYKFEDYLSKIDIESKRLLNHPLPKCEQLGGATTYLTWRITFDKIATMKEFGAEATQLMRIISFLSPENISSDFLFKILSKLRYQNKFFNRILHKLFSNKKVDEESSSRIKGLEVLRDHSMISLLKNNNLLTISIHRLVQEVTRLKLSEDGLFNESLDHLLAGVVEMLINNDIPSHQLIHAQTIWDHASGIKELIEKHGNFPDWICMRLNDSGKYQEMYDFSCRSLNVLEAAVGERSRWTLNVKYWKGSALEELGKYSKSLELQIEVYETQKEIFGEEDDDTLWTANRIGSVHQRLENYDEALKWFGEALEKREKIAGSENGLTLGLKANMALVLKDQGKYEEALRMYKEVLQVRERVSGKENSETLTTKHNIATVTYSMKDYVGALQIFQEVLEVRKRILEADHPNTLLTKGWIADTLECLGRMYEAFELMKEVHEKRYKVLGPTHPQTIIAKNRVETLKKSLSSPNNNAKVSK